MAPRPEPTSRAARASAKATTWITDRLAGLDATVVADVFMTGIDRAASGRWDAAVERAQALPGTVRPEKIRALTQAFARELATVGAATGAAAAAPSVGTAATLAVSTAELAWFTARSGDLILTIAALHGRHEPSVEERRAWVLAVLIFGGSAREGFTSAARQLGLEIDASNSRLPLASLRAINGVLSGSIVRRYGSRRGAIALGTALPLGIGAFIGGSANYAAVRALARNADRFFAQLPYSAIDTQARDITDQR